MWLRILQNTPPWVFVLLLALIALGLLQARARSMPISRVLVLPLVLWGLSLAGVLSTFGASGTALGAWGLALTLTFAASRRRVDTTAVRFAPDSRRLSVPGSLWPLGLMLGIFSVKYVVGASLALKPELRDAAGFAGAASAAYGLFSGAFLGRAWAWWSVARGARALQAA